MCCYTLKQQIDYSAKTHKIFKNLRNQGKKYREVREILSDQMIANAVSYEKEKTETRARKRKTSSLDMAAAQHALVKAIHPCQQIKFKKNLNFP